MKFQRGNRVVIYTDYPTPRKLTGVILRIQRNGLLKVALYSFPGIIVVWPQQCRKLIRKKGGFFKRKPKSLINSTYSRGNT